MKKKKICACILACVICTGNMLPVFAADVPEIADVPDMTGIEEFIEETEVKEDGNVEITEEDTEKESGMKTETEESGEGITEFEAPLEEALFSDGESPASFSSEEGDNASLFLAGGEEETGTEGLIYEYVEETDSYKVVKGVDVDTVHIPETYEGKPVTEIVAGAFVNFHVLQHLTIAQPAFMFRTGAFQNCSNLRTITNVGGMSINIESQAFTDCHKLADIRELESSAQSPCTIAPDAFDPDSKVIIWSLGDIKDSGDSFCALDGEGSFHYSTDGVTYAEGDWIEDLPVVDTNMAVTDCDNSQRILHLEEHDFIRSIYRKAFYGCDNLEEVTLNQEMEYIQTKAFAYCTSLHTVYMPSSVKEIADDAFIGCNQVSFTGVPGTYAEKYANEHGIPFQAALSAPIITNVTVNKNMVTVELNDFYGDMYYCVAGTDLNKKSEPIRGRNGRIATYQKGNKVIFRNLNKGTYFIGTRALSLEGNKKTYSSWSNVVRVDIHVNTPLRPTISSVNVSGRNIHATVELPKGIAGYDVRLSRGTKKNDSSTAGVAIPAPEKAVYGRSNPANGTKANITIRNVKPGTYYLGIQAYSSQEGNIAYSQWSPLRKITITK